MIVLALLMATAAVAQDRFVVAPPDPTRITVYRNLAYRVDPQLALDLYRPAGTDTVPLLIFVNNTGGPYPTWPIYVGWASTAAANGLGAVLYQATAEKPLDDFDGIITYLRQHASHHIDPTRVVVWSGSANVRLGLPLAMDRKRDYIRGAAVFYGSADVADIRTDLPLLYVRSGLDNTGLNREIDALVVRALAANAPWIVENNAAGYHGFEVLNDNDVSREVIARTVSFARSVMRPEVSRTYASLGDDAAVGAAFAREEWSVAVEGYRKRVAANPRDAESQRRLGVALMATRQYADALNAFESAWQYGRRGIRDTVYPAAQAAARAGNVERAFFWLNAAFSSQFGPPLTEIRTSEVFANVRNEPAFKQLLDDVEEQQRLLAMIDKGESSEALKIITTSPRERYQREGVLNNLGYRLLSAGKRAEAITVLKLNADRHPDSANVWDSLAEAAEAATVRPRHAWRRSANLSFRAQRGIPAARTMGIPRRLRGSE